MEAQFTTEALRHGEKTLRKNKSTKTRLSSVSQCLRGKRLFYFETAANKSECIND